MIYSFFIENLYYLKIYIILKLFYISINLFYDLSMEKTIIYIILKMFYISINLFYDFEKNNYPYHFANIFIFL